MTSAAGYYTYNVLFKEEGDFIPIPYLGNLRMNKVHLINHLPNTWWEFESEVHGPATACLSLPGHGLWRGQLSALGDTSQDKITCFSTF